MSVVISVVETPAELREFVRFPLRLYNGNPFWVPPLLRDEIDTLTPGRNPALKNAERELLLARRDGRTVGRVAAILSHPANEKYGTKNLRFGWFEAIDDYEVTEALFSAVEAWGRQKGMTTLTGPQGFTDLDFEGLLVEGYTERATILTIYNPPYYPRHLERYGFAKEVDYVEFQGLTPERTALPERLVKMAEWAARRNNLRLARYANIRKMRKERARELFDLLNETFDELYGTTPLTQEQRDYYIARYIAFANPEFIKIVVNEKDEMVGFLLSLPSLSAAFQKARGRLFPLGFAYILLALRKFDTLDLMVAGVKKPYRGKGVDLIMTIDLFRSALAHGVRFSESNPELETNKKVQNEWKIVATRQHKRRRIYKKSIN